MASLGGGSNRMGESAIASAVKIVQVGLGSFGRSWARIVETSPHAALAAIVDPSAAARQAVRDDLERDMPAFADLSDALDDVACDALLVVTPPETHFDVVTVGLQAGKHVMVEKPLATTYEEAARMLTTSEETGRTLMVSQNYRYRRPLRTVQRFVADGRLGALISVSADFRRHVTSLFGRDNFRYSMMHPLVLDMSIHHFDLLRAITGRNVVSVDARSWRRAGSGFVHDPAVAALMDLDGGVPFSYRGDWAPRASEHDTTWNAEWTIHGEKGTLVWVGDVVDSMTGRVVFEPLDGEAEVLPQPDLTAIDRAGALAEFVAALQEGRKPETCARDNIRSLAIVLATTRSIDEGRSVRLDSLGGVPSAL